MPVDNEIYDSAGDAWWDENRMQANEGVSVPGFPNFFHIIGPYGFNGSSFFLLIETQMRHINRCLKRARQTGSTRDQPPRQPDHTDAARP